MSIVTPDSFREADRQRRERMLLLFCGFCKLLGETPGKSITITEDELSRFKEKLAENMIKTYKGMNMATLDRTFKVALCGSVDKLFEAPTPKPQPTRRRKIDVS